MLELCQHQAPHSCPNYAAKQMAPLSRKQALNRFHTTRTHTHTNILMIIRVKYMPGMFFFGFLFLLLLLGTAVVSLPKSAGKNT